MCKGFVALVGAGPGSVGLLTVRAHEYIQKADVVVYDRLVSEDILKLVPANTKMINVGKQSSNHLVPQHGINCILLEEAQQGQLVVRLKGGDPFVFGRGGEELELLNQHNIPFEVVPGITSAISVPTYAGIPVSHRDFCSSIHIITGHQKENEPLNINFEALVNTGGTLIFLMGVSSLGQICQGLLQAGMEGSMPAAVVENGTRNNQRKVLATLNTLPDSAKAHAIHSPAIIIVGKVCQLSNEYDWFTNRELSGCEVIVTRPAHIDSTLSKGLSELGAVVHDCPCIHVRPLPPTPELNQTIRAIKQYQWLVFTSKNGVQFFFDYLSELQLDTRILGHAKIAAIGNQTAHELKKHGVIADYIPEVFDGEHLGHGLVQQSLPTDQILLLRALTGSERITEILDEAKRSYKDIPVYQTTYACEDATRLSELAKSNKNSYVIFTSASTVEGFVQAVSEDNTANMRAICIGQQTTQAAKKHQFQTYTATQATINSLIEKVKEVYHANKTTQA